MSAGRSRFRQPCCNRPSDSSGLKSHLFPGGRRCRNGNALANRCFDLLPPGGRLVITAPAEVLAADIINTGSYRDNLRQRPWIICRQFIRLPFPFLSWTRWKRSMKKFYWMIWPYRQSCVVLQKPVSSANADSGTGLPHHDRDQPQPSPGTPAQP